MSDSHDPISASAELSAALEQARAKGPDKPGASKTTLILAGALLVVAGFAGGYVTKGATGGSDNAGGFSRAGGPGGFGGGFRGGQGGPGGGQGGGPQNLTIGTITKVDGDTVTIKTTSGTSVQAKISSGTNVNVTSKGSVKDLSKGDEIVVNGQRDGDTIDAEFVSKGRAFGPRMERRTDAGSGAGG